MAGQRPAEFADLLRKDCSVPSLPQFRVQLHVRDEQIYADAELLPRRSG